MILERVEKLIKDKTSRITMPESIKKLLNYSKDEVIGLDAGSSSIKIVQLQKNKSGYNVLGAQIASLENNAEAEEAAERTNTVNTIHACLENGNFSTKLSVCGLCGPEVAVRPFKFPPLPKEEVEGAIMIEASQVCPFSIEEGTVDYQLITNGQDSAVGFLVAATNELLKAKRKLAGDASANCVLMDVDGLALLNCLSQYEDENKKITTAVLNIGNKFTTLAIVGQDNLPFVRDIPYAGKDITQQIAAEHGCPVEQVRQTLSNTEDKQKQEDFADAINRCCRKLIVDINDTLRYYVSQEKSTTVEKILVCGGFSLVGGIVELLDRHLDATVVLWNPLEKMNFQTDQVSEDTIKTKGPALAVAAGLAMRSI